LLGPGKSSSSRLIMSFCATTKVICKTDNKNILIFILYRQVYILHHLSLLIRSLRGKPERGLIKRETHFSGEKSSKRLANAMSTRIRWNVYVALGLVGTSWACGLGDTSDRWTGSQTQKKKKNKGQGSTFSCISMQVGYAPSAAHDQYQALLCTMIGRTLWRRLHHQYPP
jgi:hypothetical protein